MTDLKQLVQNIEDRSDREKRIKHAICRGCLKSYPRKTGAPGRYCSPVCKVKNPRKRKKCKPACNPNNKQTRLATFRDGSQHWREECRLCRRARYVSGPNGCLDEKSVEEGVKRLSEERINRWGDHFYSSAKWLHVRYLTLRKYGAKCMLCGCVDKPMHVDHIKPRSKFPWLALDINNLQVLCVDCNMGKSNKDETDWRPQVGDSVLLGGGDAQWLGFI